MNYTNKKQSVIFELPLAGYLGDRPTYKTENIYTPEEFKNAGAYNGRVYHDRHGWKSEEEAKAQGFYNKPIRVRNGSQSITTLQEKEENLLDSFDSFWEYVEVEPDDIKEAREYLIGKGYTPEELDQFADELKTDIHRAKADAYNQNHQDEWFKKYRKLTQEKIIDDLSDALSGIDYKLIDQLDADDYFKTRAEANHLRLEIKKADIKKWLKDNNYYIKEAGSNYVDDADYFAEMALDFNRKEIDLEQVDYYGTLGSYDGWLEYFFDYEETAGTIDSYRLDETSKINNLERASLEAKPHLEAIESYINKYISPRDTSDQQYIEANTKIIRQIKALKSIIKNAV